MAAKTKSDGDAAGEPGELLDFDAWTRLAARLQKKSGEERATILAAERVDPETFGESDRHHREVMEADLAAGRTRRAERYGAACAEEMERRRALPRGPEAGAAPPAAAAPEAPLPEPATPHVDTPSFLLDHRESAAPAAPLTMQPFVKDPRPLDETGKTKAPTVAIPAIEQAAEAEPLPFGKEVSPEFVEQLAAPRAPKRAADAGGTLDVSEILAGPALPFPQPSAAAPEGSRSSAPPNPPQATPSSPSRSSAPPNPPRAASVTAEEVRIGGLNVRQYASLCTELSLYPDRAVAVLRRYGLQSPEAYKQVGAQWEHRMTGDPALRRLWNETCVSYREWLLTQRR